MVPCCCPIARWVVRGLVIAAALTLVCWTLAPVRSQGLLASGAANKVPTDAVGFLSIKVRDVWNAEALSSVRQMFTKAGPEALEAFQKQFKPSLAAIDSVAFFFVPRDEDGPPFPGAVIYFNTAFDPEKVLKDLMPQGKMQLHVGQKYVDDVRLGLAILAVDNRTLQVTTPSLIQRLITHQAQKGPLASHFANANSKPIYGALSLAHLPAAAWEEFPEAIRPLGRASEAVLTGDVSNDVALKLTMKYPDGPSAEKAEAAARAGFKLLRQPMAQFIKEAERNILHPDQRATGWQNLPNAIGELMTLASLKSVDQMLETPPLSRKGDSLALETRFNPNDPKSFTSTTTMLIGALVPAVQATRVAANRIKAQNNLKQLALAMQNYEASHGRLPPAAMYSRDNKRRLLSWRVAILPYLEHDALYKQFKLDEPWDSDHNKRLIARMPAVFADPDAPPGRDPGLTNYRVFMGGGAGFRDDGGSVRVADISDGTSNTIMIATSEEPVIWTKPDELEYGVRKPVPKLGFGSKPINVAFFDGSVRPLPASIPDRTLRALITATGGELIGDDAFRPDR